MNETDLKLTIGFVALVLMFGVGWAVGDPRTSAPVPQEHPHPAVVVAQAFAGPMQLMKPAFAERVEAKPSLLSQEGQEVAQSKAKQALVEDLLVDQCDKAIGGMEEWVKWLAKNSSQPKAEFEADLQDYVDFAAECHVSQDKVDELAQKARQTRLAHKA